MTGAVEGECAAPRAGRVGRCLLPFAGRTIREVSVLDDPTESAWIELLADWDNDDRHKGFVGLARASARLPDAARRYRALLDDPTRGAGAKRGLDRVLGVAMQALTPQPRDVRPRTFNLGPPLAGFSMALVFTILTAQVTGIRAIASPLVIIAEALIVALIPWRRFTDDGDSSA